MRSVYDFNKGNGFIIKEEHVEDITKKEILIKYFDEEMPKLRYVDGKSDWIDLMAAEDIEIKKGEFKLIPLGVAMKLPEGYEAYMLPRSSTFKNYGVLQTNSQAIIDETYCGNEDMWRYPVYATKATKINKYDRICQFRIQKHQPSISFKEVKRLEEKNRGGFGSTGVN